MSTASGDSELRVNVPPELMQRIDASDVSGTSLVAAASVSRMASSAQLPSDIARCAPLRPCPQQSTCARAQAPTDSLLASRVDGSAALSPRSKACWLYLDVRGLALIAQEGTA